MNKLKNELTDFKNYITYRKLNYQPVTSAISSKRTTSGRATIRKNKMVFDAVSHFVNMISDGKFKRWELLKLMIDISEEIWQLEY